MALLELQRLNKNFGGLAAVSSLDLAVPEGEILGLIGPNGSGKTTVFNLITGFHSPSSGKVVFRGEDIGGKLPHVVSARGIGRVFQLTALFRESTVLENVVIAYHTAARTSWGGVLNTPAARKEEREIEGRARQVLELVGLKGAEEKMAIALPYGHQRALSVAIALATNPKLLLLDEPVTGMNAQEIAAMMSLIRRLRERGITLIVVEHHMKTIMELCQRIVVLNYGKKIAEGTPQEVSRNGEVIEAYLGAEDAARS